MEEQMTTTVQLKNNQKGFGRQLVQASVAAIILSTLANVALYIVAGWFNPVITAWAGAGIGQIVGANMVYLFVGTVAFALIAKVTSRPARIYTAVATLGLLGSLWLPISAAIGLNLPAGTPAATLGTAVVLSLMHVISYTISVPMFVRLVEK